MIKKLTIDLLLGNAATFQAIIDRALQTQTDKIMWQRFLQFEQTPSRDLKAFFGNAEGVEAGSFIDRNSRKPIRERRDMGNAAISVAIMGDRYQMDNDRLDKLQQLIDKYNYMGAAEQGRQLTDIINYLVDDVRQCTLAPHKRMDYCLGQLLSTGGAPEMDIPLPVITHSIPAALQDNLLTEIFDFAEGLQSRAGRYGYMLMNGKTYRRRITASKEFLRYYKNVTPASKVAASGAVIPVQEANAVLSGVGMPQIEIISDYAAMPDGTYADCFADNRITLVRSLNLGKMLWHTPYEITDPVPDKVYTQLAGGHYVCSRRTDEGRFTEYMAEWIPNIAEPNKIAVITIE